jgi:asparagine synthase (glutamine-hydrolysing)
VRIVRYWDLDYPRVDRARPASGSRQSEAEQVERLRETLAEAVRLRLRADVPVGIFLSGGLDSSVVLGMAAEAQAGLRAFTVTFDHPAYDEGPIAVETAARAGAEYQAIPIDQNALADHVSDAVWHGETLGGNGMGVARYLQSRAVHQAGYRVVLSGDGADEIFAGYLYFRHDHLLHARNGLDEAARKQLLEALLRDNPAFRAGLTAPESAVALAGVERLLGFAPSWMKATAFNRAGFHALLAPGFAAAVAGRDPQLAFVERFDVAGQLAGRERVRQSLYLWLKSMLPNQVLIADRLDMAHGVEVRMPFLDHHVAELARDMPVSLLIRGLTEKYVLRQASRRYVSDRVYKRPKHPFTAPHATLDTNGGLHRLTQDVLRSSVLGDLPFFDARAVTGLLDRLPGLDHRQRIALDSTLFLILCACILQQRYRIGGS